MGGRIIFITGASSGLGRATALKFAKTEPGVELYLMARRKELLEDTAKEIKEAGCNPHIIIGDVSKHEDVEKAMEEIKNQHGRIDVLLVNAGTNGKWAPIEELESEDWDRTTGTNLDGAFFTVKYGVPLMKEKGGSILINASINGTRSFSKSGATIYATTKGALTGWGKCLSLELSKYKIRVNIICPGSLESEIHSKTETVNLESVRYDINFDQGQIPLTKGAMPSAQPFAELCYFLSSEGAAHITGSTICVDGGESLLT